MSLPNIALHSHHNASVSVEHNGDIVEVIELERFVTQSRALNSK